MYYEYYKKKVLIVFAHLDDEFALAPLIKHLAKKNKNIKVLYCAERKLSDKKYQDLRRNENKTALNYLGIKNNNIIYINDECFVNDLEIHLSKSKIYNYISRIYGFYKFELLLTLSLEGGHPDHDTISLIINKFSKINKIKTMFFPAYNYRKTLFFIPYSVLRPLKNQNYLFKKATFENFCWIHSLMVALFYKTEWRAFIKLIPFIIFNLFFSNFIYYSEKIELKSVDWRQSLTSRRYKVNPELFINI